MLCLSTRAFNSAPAPGTERSIPSTTTFTRCRCRSCSANFSIGSVRRAANTRFAFRSASSHANSIPNPLDAPVTSAHLLFTSFILSVRFRSCLGTDFRVSAILWRFRELEQSYQRFHQLAIVIQFDRVEHTKGVCNQSMRVDKCCHGWLTDSFAAIFSMASRLRVTSESVVAQDDTLILIAFRPFQSVPPHQQVPSF
jgi:hypothetical protein